LRKPVTFTDQDYVVTDFQVVKELLVYQLIHQFYKVSVDSGWESKRYRIGGAKRDRTADPLRARQVLSQLSYSPSVSCLCFAYIPRATSRLPGGKVVGLGGLEPPTSPLSGVRSNQLSYRPWAHTATDQNNLLWMLMPTRGCLCKEVIQPQVPLGLPCYDFTPVMNHKVVSALPKVRLPTSFATHSHGVTGGVYKARERIHRDILIRDY
jgi:hypothetical protein